MIETIQIKGRERTYTIHIHSCGRTDVVILYLTMPRSMADLSDLYQHTRQQSGGCDYTMISVEIADWDGELSPWKFQEVNGRMSFAGRGGQLMADLEQAILPGISRHCCIALNQIFLVIAGYSLAGLFSVWTMYQTNVFQAAVSCSGSLWYPDFLKYALEHELQGDCMIYLSLGDKEEKTRNPYMAQVGEATRTLYQKFEGEERVRHTMLEWNAGNHFHQMEERLSKGMVWMLNQVKHF